MYYSISLIFYLLDKESNNCLVKSKVTPSIPDNSGHFDWARVLRIVMKSGLKKLVECESYLYILVL